MAGPILVIPYGHALSHVSRPLRLAEELRSRGHEVVFAGGGANLDHVRRRGFDVHELYELPHDVLFGRIRDHKLQFIKTGELRALVDADLEVFAKVRPSLVLTDGRISARLSTASARIQHAAIVNVSSTHHRAVPYVPLFEAVRPTFLQPSLRRLNLWIEMQVFDQAVRAFRQIAKDLGLPPVATATNCLEGNDLTLLPDIPEFMPSRGLPAGHHYVGPLTFQSDLPDPPWWSNLLTLKGEGKKIIYFTLGTTGTKDLFDRVLGGLGTRSDVVVVVSAGGQLERMPAYDNVFVTDFLDGDAVMQVADLVVCHGGNGTIYQALAHRVPVAGLPTIPDQSYNMRRVEAMGYGRQWKELPDDLVGQVAELSEAMNAPPAHWWNDSVRRGCGFLERLGHTDHCWTDIGEKADEDIAT